MSKLYYLQDSRQIVGNSILWWKKDHCGYTTNLEEAHVFTEREAFAQHTCRETDIPWDKDFVDARTERTANVEKVRRFDHDYLLNIVKEIPDEQQPN